MSGSPREIKPNCRSNMQKSRHREKSARIRRCCLLSLLIAYNWNQGGPVVCHRLCLLVSMTKWVSFDTLTTSFPLSSFDVACKFSTTWFRGSTWLWISFRLQPFFFLIIRLQLLEWKSKKHFAPIGKNQRIIK